jgi:thioesterase domain-containing protein
MATFFQRPTVTALARELERDAEPAPFETLLPLRADGSRPPFFCVHSIGGRVVHFYDLVRHLDPEQPVYGIQARDPAEIGDCPPIESLAADYLRAVRELQPRGPYYLGGFSFGSAVAFEMARQLTAEGEEVGLLALLDGGSPQQLRSLGEAGAEKALLAGFARDLGRSAGVELDLPHDTVKGLDLEALMEHVLDRLRHADLVRRDLGVPWIRRFLAGVTARLMAVRAYRPEVYDGPVTYFHSTLAESETAADWRQAGAEVTDRPSQGWEELTTRPIELHAVPGHHATILAEPQVRVLASQLQSCLDRAQGVERETAAEAATAPSHD